ncbi:MAG: UPF0182 family protein, partial [Candidatus Latescibacterota bacterium]
MPVHTSRGFAITVAVVAILGLNWMVSLYTDWLWFGAVGYEGVFWRTVQARLGSGMLLGAVAAAVIGINLHLACRRAGGGLALGRSPFASGPSPLAALLRSRKPYLLATAGLGLLMGGLAASQWPLLWRFLHAQPFGVADPIFGRDIGFYVFSLPFYRFLVDFLIFALVLSAAAVVLVYVAGGAIQVQPTPHLMPRPLVHLSALGGALLLLLAATYRLKVYGLLFGEGRIYAGAGYADVHVQTRVYWALAVLLVAAAGLLLLNLKGRRPRRWLLRVGLAALGALVVGAVPGRLVQALVVDPNELEKEGPYMAHNIRATRAAYALDRIAERPFEVEESLTRGDIEANPLTIRNVRVWDQPPMAEAYQQIQTIRPYYVFPEVDVDRYHIDGVYRQVMLAGRELDTRRLPPQARKWVNEWLQYTHGYGVSMSPVNRITPEGLPDFFMRDIPPVATSPELALQRPEIYYGERTHGAVVVNTGVEEFDYPRGDENVFSTYEGTGGVGLAGYLTRLAFAVRFRSPNLVLSSYIRPDSQLLLYRHILERARQVAPFLLYDQDPYLVVAEGRLFWILDAYTTTDMYPYSRRAAGRA